MNATEFSDEFDVLYNNIMSNNAPGLNEYEKSVFLTKAQNEIIKNYFNPKGNKYGEGFDDSQKRQIDFSNLESVASFSLGPLDNTDFFKGVQGAYSINIPSNAFIIINEVVDVLDSNSEIKRLQVIPLKYDEYTRLASKPYKQPLKNQAWRINIFTKTKTSYLWTDPLTKAIHKCRTSTLLIGHNNTTDDTCKYYVRFIKKPYPIILEDLGSTNSIEGQSKPLSEISNIEGNLYYETGSPCELSNEIHPEILQRAVELAKVAYVGDINSQTQMGQRSE